MTDYIAPYIPFAIVDRDGRPTAQFQAFWASSINRAVANALAAEQAAAAADLAQTAAATAQTAAATANTAATAASTAAASAASAAGSAQTTADAAAHELALVNSWITPDGVLTTTTTTITVAAHTRHYADGTSVSVNGGTLATTGTLVDDYVSYSDPSRAGGTVLYVAATSQPAQGNGIHVVGAVAVPAAGSATGGFGPRKPGFVDP